MSLYDIMTTEYWGVPLWGWIIIILVIVGIIVAVRGSMAKKKDAATKKEAEASADVEAGAVKLPEGQSPKTPSPVKDFPRDAPLPPPAPSETSNRA